MDKKAVKKLEGEYIRYIETIRYCKDVDKNFIFAGDDDSDESDPGSYIGYDDYSDYSDD